jgi:hypothetical protein
VKTKLGTILDQGLLRRARSMAAREGKRLNQVIEEALIDHLKRRDADHAARVTLRTAGCIRVSKRVVDRILEREPGLLEK